jgi:hypothetical protein
MSTNPGSESKRTALAAAGFLLVPIVCCGLPVLIAAGALGAVGSVLGNPWVIGTALRLRSDHQGPAGKSPFTPGPPLENPEVGSTEAPPPCDTVPSATA